MGANVLEHKCPFIGMVPELKLGIKETVFCFQNVLSQICIFDKHGCSFARNDKIANWEKCWNNKNNDWQKKFPHGVLFLASENCSDFTPASTYLTFVDWCEYHSAYRQRLIPVRRCA
jgi:hypothetical protein